MRARHPSPAAPTSSMARLLFGLPSLRGKLANYAKRYDLVEVTPDQPLPKASKLARWREEVPPGFAFSVVLPSVVATLDRTGAYGEGLSRSHEAIKALQASAVILVTPPSVRPTKQNRERIARLREKLPADGCVVGWEARGMWEPEDFIQTAIDLGFLPIFDAAQDPLPPGPIAYTRLRALGMSAQIGQDRVSRIAEQLAGRREAYCVAEPEIAGRVRAGLTRALADMGERRQVPMIFRPSAELEADDEEQ